jgi:hypothetical protein
MLIATHLTSTCDEYGRPRPKMDFALADLFGAHTMGADEIPDLYLKTADGQELPQDPQTVRLFGDKDAVVLARTLERGEHSRYLGPAVVLKGTGKGRTIYIGSGLEAIYEETRMAPIRDYIGSLVESMVGSLRRYQVDARPGLMAHFTEAGANDLLLHLLANTGNKVKKLRMREEYLPIPDVRARIRIPAGRAVKKVTALRDGRVTSALKDGWVELGIPQVKIHEAIHVELG